MPLSAPTTAGPIHWVLDWDGTLTERDTLHALVNIAANCKPTSPVLEEWTRVSRAYIADYENTLQVYAPGASLPSTVADEKALLGVLEAVEQRSVDRVSASAIFKGLTLDDLEKGAAEAVETDTVHLREGCTHFLSHVQSRKGLKEGGPDATSILSVNWSRRFIAGCLRAARVNHDHPILTSIYSNELEVLEPGQTTSGRICVDPDTRIISSGDKLVQLELLRQKGSKTPQPVPVVYVGDSWTDLECLLAADMGICIRDEPMTSTQKKLQDSLARVGVECVRLHAGSVRGVVWVRSFEEIIEWRYTKT